MGNNDAANASGRHQRGRRRSLERSRVRIRMSCVQVAKRGPSCVCVQSEH